VERRTCRRTDQIESKINIGSTTVGSPRESAAKSVAGTARRAKPLRATFESEVRDIPNKSAI
jgi:hypothetical protein